MEKFPHEDLGDIFSADAFDLAALGLMNDLGEEEAAGPEDDGTPRVAPAHDMDSLDFFLWMEEEVDKEQARRQAEKAKQAKP